MASKQAAKEAGGAEPRQPSVTPKSLKRPRTHTPPRGMLEQQQWAAVVAVVVAVVVAAAAVGMMWSAQ